MAPQPSPSSTTSARNGRRSVRRRALVAALGLAVLAAVVPVTAAHAAPQSPQVDTQLTNPGGNPQPPADHDPTRPSTTRSRSRGRSTPGSAGPPTGPTRPPAWPWSAPPSCSPCWSWSSPAASAPRPGAPDDLRGPRFPPPQPQVRRLGLRRPARRMPSAGRLPGPGGGPRAGQPVPPTRAAGTAGSGRPVSIQVPAIGVDARVVPVGLGPNRSMEVPAVDRPVLRLITCGGCFDHATGHDRDNVIVYAGLTKP